MPANKKGIPIWLHKADNDWLNVQNNLAASRIPWDTVCFHAQQAIEKSLKALLLHRGIVPPRVHDLVKLIDASPVDSAELKQWRKDFRELNGFAVKSRYGGKDPAPAKARVVVKRAEQIRKAVLELIEAKSVKDKAVRAKKKK